MSNPFFRRLSKEDKKDILHSSAYAKAQNSGGIGADSVESFNRRREIDQKRAVIRKYDDSKVAVESGVHSEEARDSEMGKSERGKDRFKLEKSSVGYGRYSRKMRDTGEDAKGTAKFGFVEPSSNRPESGPPARRNPGISR